MPGIFVRIFCSHVARPRSNDHPALPPQADVKKKVRTITVVRLSLAVNEMPRTKYTRKPKATSETDEEYDMMMNTFDKHVQMRVAKLERDAQAEIKSFETFVDLTVSRLPAEIRRMTLSEILAWQSDSEKENLDDDAISSSTKDSMKPPAAMPKLKSKTKRATTTSDDGYATEGAISSVSNTSRAGRSHAQVPTTTRRTRSATRASRAKLSEINEKILAKPGSKDRLNVPSRTDIFKTPAIPKSTANTYDIVTPKIKPNTPLNVLRRPRQGEMVLSMQGSPLLVSAVVEEKTANINVPLANGNVISLLPQEGLRMSNIPQLDPETMHQLETLKNHIEKVIALK